MSPVTHFAQPLWLLAGAIAVPVLLLLYRRFDWLQRRRVQAFSLPRDTDSASFGVSHGLLWTKRVLLCLAVLAACAALARPLGSMQVQESERRGLDILFAVDTSRSMLTPDVKPDRLTRAKLAVEDLIDHLDGDGVGLVAFAGEAFLQAPVTTDYDAFRETLQALDTHTIAVGGTDIAAAIRLGESTLAQRGDTQKVLVLITDGEDLAGDAMVAAQAAAKKGMIIFTAGVGTAAGELIPVPDDAGGTQFVKDPQGNFVKSRLDSDMLTQIAAVTGGVYTPLGPQGQGIVSLYEQKLKGLAQRQHADRQIAVYAQLFQWPLGAAIALLILEWLLGVSVRRRSAVGMPANAALVLALLSGLILTRSPNAHGSPRTAQDAYQQGQYTQAQRDYAQSLKADPARAHLQFNLGAAAYRAGDFATAAAAFNSALQTRDIPEQERAYYNLGNALFRQGEKAAANDPQSSIKTWQQSLGSYETALQMQPGDADARFNRDVVKKRLEELQQQQQQQPQKQQQNQDQGQGQDQNQGKNDRNQQRDQPQRDGQQPQQGPQQDSRNPQGSQDQQPGQPQDRQSGPRPPQGAAAAQDIGKPDQMSKQEAEQLLDSTKGQERRLATGARNGKPENALAVSQRDW